MSGLDLTIPAGERGRIRVFSLSMSADEAENLELGRALGKYPDDPSRVEVFPVRNLEGLGLAGYLVEGCGVPEAQIAPDRTRLDALDGHVLLLFSRAYGDAGVTLEPEPALTLIGTYTEERRDITATPIETESAKPYTGTRRPSPREARAASRRAGAIVFAIVMAILALILILVL